MQRKWTEALGALGLTLSAAACDRLQAHLNLIAKWNRVYNLTAVRDPAEMVTHHLLDSLAAVPPLAAFLLAHRSERGAISQQASPAEAQAGAQPGHSSGALAHHPVHILDVGAGAGLPGVTIAIALPEALAHRAEGASEGAPLRVTCVDAVAKKAGFIRQVAAELGLSQLQALHGRIESLSIPQADVITCRAFASLSDIVRLTHSHLAPGGVWMALKGVVPNDEIAALPPGIEVFHVEPLRVPGLDAQRCLVWMRPSQPRV